MKRILLICAILMCAAPSQSQFLKKIKDKVNKTIDKATGDDTASRADSTAPDAAPSRSRTSPAPAVANRAADNRNWCDTVQAGGPIAYSTVYAGTGQVNIVYSESSVGLGRDAKGYRLILTEKKDGAKQEFLVLEEGKVIDRGPVVKKQYVGRGVSDEFAMGGDDEAYMQEMKKYIVADSTKLDIPKTDARSVTVKKVDEDQMEKALAIARETDDYKSMTEEEKKEFEEAMKKGLAQQNAMAGQTVSIPGQQGGSMAMVTGYKVVVNGKNYGKFQAPPVLDVSRDGASVFAVGVDEKASPWMVTSSKKAPLDAKKFSGTSGKMFRSSDGKKVVYIEMKPMSNAEMQDVSAGRSKMVYNVLRPDGSSLQVTDQDQSGQFKITNAGAVVSINASTGEVFADGKSVGKFTLQPGKRLELGTLLMGSSVSKIAYYDGATGSLNYLDGSSVNLGILYPAVIVKGGKSYLTWFRKCQNKILLAEYAF